MHDRYRTAPGVVQRLLLAVCCLSLAWEPAAYAQETARALGTAGTVEEGGRPFITNYATVDYGADFQNWAIVQDDRGVLYVGNSGGLLEYDGATWRLIEITATVRSMAKDASGRIYVGSVGDLGYLAPDSLRQMTFVSLRGAVPEAHRDFTDVWNVDIVDGEVYFNTSQKIYRWDGETMRVWSPETPFHVTAVVDGTYYVRQWEVGLMRKEGEELRLVPGGGRFAQERIYVMLPFGDGRVLIGTRSQGFFLFDPSATSDEAAVTPLATEIDGELERATLYLPGAVLPGGRFALGTHRGLYVIDREGRLLHHVDRASGLRDNVIFFTYVDAEGALWLAFDNGLARVEIDAPQTYLAAAEGLSSAVLSLERHGGRLYAGTTTGLVRLDEEGERFDLIEGAGIQVFDLLSVGGDLLLTSSLGLQQLDGDRVRTLQSNEGSSFRPRLLHRSRQDSARVYVSTAANGLHAVRRTAAGKWVDEGMVPGTAGRDGWSIAEPEPGTLWIGTRSGRAVRVRLPDAAGTSVPKQADVTTYGQEHGLENLLQVAAVGDHLLFVTRDGLFRFDDATERFSRDTTTFPGADLASFQESGGILEDREGRAWLTTGRGLAVAYSQPGGSYRLEKAQFRRFAETAVSATYPEPDGVVWFYGSDRLIRFDLDAPAADAVTFPTLVRRVTTSEGRLLYAGTGAARPFDLHPADRSIRFEYAAPAFVESGRTEYQVLLDGFDPHPSAWTREAMKEYTNLPPGAYTFRVRSRDVSGREGAEATYTFRVLAPWYQTPWAYLLYVLAAGGLVVGLVQLRTRHLHARSRMLEETVHARTAELEQRVAELAVINGVQEGLVAELDMQAIYDLVGDRIRDIFDAQIVSIATFDRALEVEIFQYVIEKGVKQHHVPRSIDPLRRRLIERREPILINEDFVEAIVAMGVERPRPLPGTELPKSVLFVPLILGDAVNGYVTLQNIDREDAFSEADVRLLTTLTNSMSVALENARLFAETRQQASELDTVNRVSRALVAQLEFDALIHLVGEQIRETFRADIVYLALHDRKTGVLHFPYEYGDFTPSRPFGSGLTEKIISTREPLLINRDIAEVRRQLRAQQIGKVPASYLGVPIVTGEEAIGVISVQSTEEENRFDADDLRLLGTIAASVGVALQNAEAYRELNTAIEHLKRTQQQLVQSEKMASLGALTAGIAHEIKNPLNFVNNFASLGLELIREVQEEAIGNPHLRVAEVQEILADLELNVTKIEEHGRRADGIVRSMLEHSRGGSGDRRLVDPTVLVEEYVNLSFHGMRAQWADFTAVVERDYAPDAGDLEVVPQEIGRVLLNLLNNAFYAVHVRSRQVEGLYLPTVRVGTRRMGDEVEIRVWDNGGGIPATIREHIFEPFFTTKPPGEGTGLGLSLSYDIVAQGHGGALSVEVEEGESTEFVVRLPAPQLRPRTVPVEVDAPDAGSETV